MPAEEAVPSADEATQAVHVIVSAKRSKVQVATAQASGERARADAKADKSVDEPGFWTFWRTIGAFAVGIATIAGTAFAAIEVL
jgi:hypothetical protein